MNTSASRLIEPSFWTQTLEDRMTEFADIRELGAVLPIEVPNTLDGDTTETNYALPRFDEVVHVSKHPDQFCSGKGATSVFDLPMEMLEFFGGFINMDNPRHAHQRRIIAYSFTPTELQKVFTSVEAICTEVKGVLDTIGSTHGNGQWKQMVMVDDRIADSIFQQIQTRPADYSILATLNLNGDYISDAAAAVVGGLGMAPGANIGDNAAIFEATHGTAPKHAGLDRINPGSVILSGVMMLEFMGWQEAADLITVGISSAIANKEVTYDLARLMEPRVEPVSCSGFAEAVIKHFGG